MYELTSIVSLYANAGDLVNDSFDDFGSATRINELALSPFSSPQKGTLPVMRCYSTKSSGLPEEIKEDTPVERRDSVVLELPLLRLVRCEAGVETPMSHIGLLGHGPRLIDEF